MKTIKSRKTVTAIFAVLVLLVSASSTFAYPPDNAAVLYYKAFMLYEPPEFGPMLWDYWKGNIESNEKIEEFLKKNRRVIDIVLDATRIDHCDWGLDYSQGMEVLLPPHNKARKVFALLAAEARMQADRGDYKKALSRCISIYRMARHLNERPIICYLVGTAINSATHKYITTQFLSEMPQDTETLTWLRDELAEFDKRPFSIEPVLRWKREAGIISMSPERISDVVHSGLDDGPTKKKALERIRTADRQFFAKNIAYWSNFMDRVQTAFGLPYAEAYPTLKQLDKGPSEDFEKNPDATLTVCLAPMFLRIYVLSVRLEAQSNAIRTAVEVYLTKARTGQLPGSLPDNLRVEPFSGKPFEYTQTADGFTLRCQGKDFDKNQAYEYEFKLKK